jgi:hypothetical protein
MPRMTKAVADEADAIRARMESAVERHRADGDLSPAGRRKRIAAAYRTAASQLADLSKRFEDNASATAEQSARSLFGSASPLDGSAAVSWRDAADRCEQLTSPAEAQQLLAAAQRSGDDVLARCVAAKAYEESQRPVTGAAWMPLVEVYAAKRPGVADKLRTLHAARRNEISDLLANAAVMYAPKPPELDGLRDDQVEAMADAPDTPPTGWPAPPPARVGDVWQ